MLIDPFNADQVAFLLYGLDDFKTTSDSSSHSDDVKLPIASRFLDSLAHLAICKPSNQVVAIGLDLKDGCTGVNIVVATNEPEPEPEVTRHLQYVMDTLFDIHSAFREQENTTTTTTTGQCINLDSLDFIAADDTRPIPSLLRTLELSVLRHSIPKAAACIRKDDRYLLFKNGVNRFLAFCNGEAFGDDAMHKEVSVKNIKTISFAVDLMNFASQAATEPSERDLEKFRDASTYLERFLRGSSKDLEALESFFRNRVGTMPDVRSWLLDIVGTRTHFRRVAGIIYSSQLSGFLDHRATIRPLVNPSQSISFTITRESFGSVLDAACWNWDEKIVMADEVYKQLSKGLRKLANSRPAEVMVFVRSPSNYPSVFDEFDVATSYGAHCECVVLHYLQGVATRPTDFVGVSDLSCRLCQQYFAVTAAHMGAGYHTRGSHGQLARWRCPANSSTEVRRLVGTLLLAIFKEEMDSKARSSSVPRGSSDMSVTNFIGDEMIGRYAPELRN